MKGVAPHDRPREKLERLGPAGLGDNELLALVLGGGVRGHSVLDLANRLIEHAGGVQGFTRLSAAALRRVAGVGHARAAQVIAARQKLVFGQGEIECYSGIAVVALRLPQLGEPGCDPVPALEGDQLFGVFGDVLQGVRTGLAEYSSGIDPVPLWFSGERMGA